MNACLPVMADRWPIRRAYGLANFGAPGGSNLPIYAI